MFMDATPTLTEAANQLLTMGLAVARHAAADVEAHQNATPEENAIRIATFDRVARAVRRTILLAEHLEKTANDAAQRRTAIRKQVIRGVQNKIEGFQWVDDDRDRGELHAELRDRLDAIDFEDDIAVRKAENIIREIAQDLQVGLGQMEYPKPRRRPADVEAIRVLAAAPPKQRPGAAHRWPPPFAGPR